METLAPTPERMRKDEAIVIPTERAGVTTLQFVTQDVLDRYWRRHLLDPKSTAENARRYEAGRRLRTAWLESGLERQVTGGYVASVDGYRDPDIVMVKGIDAAREYRRLIRMVGQEDSAYVVLVCCWDKPVGKGVTMDRFRRGLSRLAEALGV